MRSTCYWLSIHLSNIHFSIINQVSVSTLDLPGFMGWDKFLNLENFLTLNHFQIWTAALGPTTKNSPSQETTLEKSNSTHIQWLNQRWGFFWEIYNKRNYLHTLWCQLEEPVLLIGTILLFSPIFSPKHKVWLLIGSIP